MTTDKVLALAREAKLAVTISSYESLYKFAALLQQQMVADGWRSPENKYDEPCDLIPTSKDRK